MVSFSSNLGRSRNQRHNRAEPDSAGLIPARPERSSLKSDSRTRSPISALRVLFFFFAFGPLLPAADLQPIVYDWLRAQTNIQTWNATVIQTRSYKTLTQPLITTGQVWFAAPNQFRWEIDRPPRTIALRQTNQLLVLYPLLKRAEVIPLTGGSGPWKDTLALLEAGFPRTASDLQDRFHVTAQSVSNQVFELTLEPKSRAARRMMPEMRVAFSTNDLVLRATQIQFTDGSTMRNEFVHPRSNPEMPPDLFHPSIDKDYKMVEPLKGR